MFMARESCIVINDRYHRVLGFGSFRQRHCNTTTFTKTKKPFIRTLNFIMLQKKICFRFPLNFFMFYYLRLTIIMNVIRVVFDLIILLSTKLSIVMMELNEQFLTISSLTHFPKSI